MLVLCGIGTVVFGGGIFALVLWFSADMREATHKFLDYVRAGEYPQAYGMTTSRFRKAVPEASFAAWVERRAPGVRASKDDSVSGFGGGSGEQCMIVSLKGDGTVYLLLVKQGEKWRVDGIETSEPSDWGCPD